MMYSMNEAGILGEKLELRVSLISDPLPLSYKSFVGGAITILMKMANFKPGDISN